VSVLASIVLAGCTEDTEVVHVSMGGMPCNLTVRVKPSPFADDPNVYLRVHIPANSFRSELIYDMVAVFPVKGGNLGCVYATAKNTSVFISSQGNRHPTVLKTASSFDSLRYEAASAEVCFLRVLGETIRLDGIRCVVFRVHSGGLFFYGFENLHDGIDACFDSTLLGKASGGNSGVVRFTRWKSEPKDWPAIESIERPEGDAHGS
jgi:hypothetical protein